MTQTFGEWAREKGLDYAMRPSPTMDERALKLLEIERDTLLDMAQEISDTIRRIKEGR